MRLDVVFGRPRCERSAQIVRPPRRTPALKLASKATIKIGLRRVPVSKARCRAIAEQVVAPDAVRNRVDDLQRQRR